MAAAFDCPLGAAQAIQIESIGLRLAGKGANKGMTGADNQPRKANLFIVGAPKCGTTAWQEYLRTHPDIFFPALKERCYFALDLPNFRLTSCEAEYARMFAGSEGAKIVGEASAMYLFSEAAAQAIRDYNPQSRILIFLRDQVEYLPSLHNQFLWEFAEEIEDFATAWQLSGKRPSETIPKACLEPRTLDYAAMGRFHEQVERYLNLFPVEQVRVIRFQDWTANPRKTYLEILDFLGLQDDGRTEFPAINEGMSYRSRNAARLIVCPPRFLRTTGRLLKTLTGWHGGLLYRVAWKAVSLLAAPGYDKRISPELCDEIRRYYAEDNRLLEKLLSRAATPVAMTSGR